MIRPSPRAIVAALMFQAVALGGGFIPPAGAQIAPEAPGGKAPADEAEFVQRSFTEDQLQKFMVAQAGIADIIARVPEDKRNAPDPVIQMRLDSTAQHFGFKDYDDFQDIGNTIDFLLEGFDPVTKTFVGHETMIKRQIAALQAEKTVLQAEKHSQIAELEEALKSIPPVKHPEEIPMVAKAYDKLSEMFADSP